MTLSGCSGSSGRGRQKQGSVGRGLSLGELVAGPVCLAQMVRASQALGTQPWGPLGEGVWCGTEIAELRMTLKFELELHT